MPTHMIGIIGGTVLLDFALLAESTPREVETPHGTAELELGFIGNVSVAFIQRHGRRRDRPPHTIPHGANFWALRELGVRRVIGIASTGCLKPDLPLPHLMVPDDYMSFGDATIFDRELIHVTPGFDPAIRTALVEAARGDGRLPVLDRGIYFQTRGPRLETRAEVAWLRGFADVVGMTVASEATVARECDLGYAALCSLDNMAHGLSAVELVERDIKASARRSAEACVAIVAAAAAALNGLAS